MTRFLVLYLAACCCILASHASAADRDDAQLLVSFFAAPIQQHPNIPDNRWAGYEFGKKPIPELSSAYIVDVREHGARGDGVTDDSKAFESSIRMLTNSGGVLQIPAGTYRLRSRLFIGTPNIVLRGSGSASSILAFETSLTEADRPSPTWSFWGGMIMFEGRVAASTVPRIPVAYLTAPTPQGGTVVEVSEVDAARMQALIGRTVIMTWRGDRSLAMAMFGHASGESFSWSKWNALENGPLTWRWANRIVGVTGRRITFEKPLRLPARAGWEVSIEFDPQRSHGCGVEHLGIRFPAHKPKPHLQDAGYNALFFSRSDHGWIHDVSIENADNGIITENCTNLTISRILMTGSATGSMHHGTSFRAGSHDIEMSDFAIMMPVYHGISAQDMASGHVWRRGLMQHGAFDSHRGMPFDLIRTDIDILGKGKPGGGNKAGPFAGRRIVHWNIRLNPTLKPGTAKWAACPDIFSMGALVGVSGSPLIPDADPWAMPIGDKGTLVISHGQIPSITDLFESIRVRGIP